MIILVITARRPHAQKKLSRTVLYGAAPNVDNDFTEWINSLFEIYVRIHCRESILLQEPKIKMFPLPQWISDERGDW